MMCTSRWAMQSSTNASGSRSNIVEASPWYGASSLCWPRLHFDLPNQILRFRPPKCGHSRSAPQTLSKNAIKYICKKGTFFWRHQDVLHPMAEYSSTPKGVLEYPWSTTRGYPLRGNMGDNTWRSSTVRFGLRDLVAYSCDAILSSN